jgi:hypothetical protein
MTVRDSPSTMTMILEIDFKDMVRATLSDVCGSVGYLGISPDGLQYHVVVPVDPQIARGIKAGNKPSDATPFGGFTGWHYFCCPGYSLPARIAEADIQQIRQEQARDNIQALKDWARLRLGVEISTSSPD